MKDMLKHREILLREAFECQLVSELAGDKTKRELFARLAEHHRRLAAELSRAIDDQTKGAG